MCLHCIDCCHWIERRVSWIRRYLQIFFSKCFTCIFLLFFFPFFLPSVTLFTFITPAKLGAGGWSPLDTNRNQWLQVDLGSRKQVVAIVTQGRYSSSDWTSKYRLLYSDTQKNWRPYLQDGNIWVSKTLMTGIKMTSHPSFNHLMQFVWKIAQSCIDLLLEVQLSSDSNAFSNVHWE